MAFLGDGSTKCFVGGDWGGFENSAVFSCNWTSNVTDAEVIGMVISKLNLFVAGAFAVGYNSLGTNSRWEFDAIDPTATHCFYTFSDLYAIGEQHTYCLVFNGAASAGSRFKLWRDGEPCSLTATTDNAITMANTATNVVVGGAYAANSLNAGYGFSGKLQEVRWWAQALDDTEAAFASKASFAGLWPWTNPFAYWPLGGLEPADAKDYSGNGRDLTPTNTPVFGEHMPSFYPRTTFVLGQKTLVSTGAGIKPWVIRRHRRMHGGWR